VFRQYGHGGGNYKELIRFTAATGTGSFADGAPNNENICEMCHTKTLFHRRDGSMAAHNDSNRCTNCHEHSKGSTTR